MGSDSSGGKINRAGMVEMDLEIPLGEKRGSEDNIHRAMVGGDEGALFTTCACQPDRDLKDAHGMESGYKNPKTQTEDWDNRKCRTRKSRFKRTFGRDRGNGVKQFDWRGEEGIGQEGCDGRVTTKHVWIYEER